MREVRRAGQRHEAAARDRGVGGAAVLDRDRAVALAPGDQRRHGLEQVEAVAALTRWPRASITARSVCTNASRAPGPLERAQRAGDRLELDARARARARAARRPRGRAPPSTPGGAASEISAEAPGRAARAAAG